MEASQPAPSGIRGDAERNRLRLLEEARELVAAGGADALTMEALAQRAGLGKGTVFRRFGSRSGLMQALLEHVEAGFRADWMSGPPPLGPGAPALARLQAFGSARLSILMVNSELARAADVDPRTRYRNPSRALAVAHLAGLLREAGPVRDPELAAYQLAAFLDAGLLLHLRGEAGMDQTRLEQGWGDLVAALVRA